MSVEETALRYVIRQCPRRCTTSVLLLCLLVSAAALAQRPLTDPADALPLPVARTAEFSVSSVTWLSLDIAADGQRMVLEVLGDLYELPTTGGSARPLTRGMAFDSQPVYAPDGKRIAFISDRDGSEGLWVLDLESGDAKRLVGGDKRMELASPTWSPDGQHVVVSRTSWGLRTFELWAHPVGGGKGLRLTRAKSGADTPASERSNSLGAVYSPDGRYLYFARKQGGFAYNVNFPLWQIVRRDLRTGSEDTLTSAPGSAIRPRLSPAGDKLVYATRYGQRTALRLRDLRTGADRLLVADVQRDEQESRFTRDLFPGYAFTPDGRALLYPRAGGIEQLTLETGQRRTIPFTVPVEQPLGEPLQFSRRLGLGPVKARLLQEPALSPDGKTLAFSAFMRIHLYDLATGDVRAFSPEGLPAFQPAWSADGRTLAYVSWEAEGGHLWTQNLRGRSRPRQITTYPAFYTEPVWAPAGDRLLVLRGNAFERLTREWDGGQTVGTDLVSLSARGGDESLILPARNLSHPHFGPDPDRIFLYQSAGWFPRSDSGVLVSVRFDGSDRRNHVKGTGPGIYYADEPVAVEDMRLSPDGTHVLFRHANQLYLTRLLSLEIPDQTVSLNGSALPLAQLTEVGADHMGWWADGQGIYWTVGSRLYQRPLASVTFDQAREDPAADAEAESADPGGDEAPLVAGTASTNPDGTGASGGGTTGEAMLKEAHPAVTSADVTLYRPRFVPEGQVALVGGTVITMEGPEHVLDDAVVLIEGDRILAVDRRDAISLSDDVRVVNVSGRYLLPGYVDTHAHYRPLRGLMDTQNWAFLANLAYGVTTGLDVQPSTTDIIAYEDLIDAGLMPGPRALSTGPGIFSHNDFQSLKHARSVLRRYREHYGVRNLKAYIAGTRQQRQWLAMAAAELRLMPTTEGALDMKLDLTHAIDGFSGNEHNLPVVNLHEDVVRLMSASGMSYTPTLLVLYGGPSAENYFYTRESPLADPKLNRFMPYPFLAARALRTQWAHDSEQLFSRVAAQARKLQAAGVPVGVGAHGQLQGLGYHWELWALASGGFSPYQALAAATRDGARIIGVDADLGTITPGKLADLVVLRSNPLVDIRASTDIDYVVRGGTLYQADTLDQVWPAQRPLPPPWWWSLSQEAGSTGAQTGTPAGR